MAREIGYFFRTEGAAEIISAGLRGVSRAEGAVEIIGAGLRGVSRAEGAAEIIGAGLRGVSRAEDAAEIIGAGNGVFFLLGSFLGFLFLQGNFFF